MCVPECCVNFTAVFDSIINITFTFKYDSPITIITHPDFRPYVCSLAVVFNKQVQNFRFLAIIPGYICKILLVQMLNIQAGTKKWNNGLLCFDQFKMVSIKQTQVTEFKMWNNK